ncbi:cache domain-containing protein [Acinetobacter boissieri]|uniref:Cache domain-containing protein n=1 Tax=Acinetobacter boissieri TaxID=1219383 RepID=A0A1G6GJ11_9GAMM|nr:cache domain-containing protein [Acinetobacter boissieri]SDB81920.1 Cache domain-containing protein [Acinetobacter boissieri]
MLNTVLLKDIQNTVNDVTACLNDAVNSLANALTLVLNEELLKNHKSLNVLEKANVQLRPIIQEKLKEYQYCSGAGFASHIEDMKDHSDYWLLEWWFKKPLNTNNQKLNLDQATQQHLDFRTFDWFTDSKFSKDTYIHGPYVDYVCNTSYTLTAAHPIFIDNTFVGVAVIDLLVSRLEELLSDYFRKLKHDLLITNTEGRVILSNAPSFRVGSLIKDTSSYEMLDHTYFQMFYKLRQ